MQLFKANLSAIFITCISIVSCQQVCDTDSFHYEFTECEDTGGRWRVSVPPTGGECDSDVPTEPPVRLHDCSVSCESGKFFNVSSLICALCPSGSYSLGGGLHFVTWDTLPKGFYSYSEAFRSTFAVGSRRRVNTDCSQYGWQTRGDVMVSQGGHCTAVLVYSVKLVKPGSLSFTYQYTDESIIFEFQAQDEQCQSIDDAEESKWPPLTKEGQWKTLDVALSAGLNVLHWKTIDIDAHGSSRPVMIKSIKVSGVAYTSECTACTAGMYSKLGAHSCLECPEGTYSNRGSSQCIDCDPKTEYAPKGSPKCLTRPPCTSQDYYEIDSACDSNNQTKVVFKWVEPRVCREDVFGAAKLPASGKVKACPPCNPGMQYTNGCSFCPRGQYSDGISSCKACAPSTAPNYGYQYQWWTSMPPGMAATCMSADDAGCSTSEGWQPGGDHIHSGRGHADDAYLVLSLKVGGFRGREGFINGRPMEVGKISFSFELSCTSDCEFVFMESSPRKSVTILQSWTGPQPRQYYNYIVTRNDTYTFSWAFQKVSWEKSYLRPSSSRLFELDMAKVYNINVTNTVDGGASTCLPCPQRLGGVECIPCPAGHYIDESSKKCLSCPENTVVSDPFPYGPKACLPCGPGLSSSDKFTCLAKCHLHVGRRHYDLKNISSHRSVLGSTLFTSSGAKYYHVFNISICGTSSVTCSNNATYLEGDVGTVLARVCRLTVVPAADITLVASRSGNEVNGASRALATQSVSLGDHLLGVSSNASLMGINVIEEFLNSRDNVNDLHFFFTTPSSTRACPDGRSTTITLRCALEEADQGQVILPRQCPDGTCDGCNFHFLWLTPLGCPMCSKDDLIIVKSECVKGLQRIHYIAPKSCRTPSHLPEEKSVPCSTHIPFIVEVIVLSVVFLAILMCLLVFCLWKKNRRLEYKYMKLIANSSSKDGTIELPPAESCALDDGEDDEIHFPLQQTKGFLGKLKQAKVKEGCLFS